MDIATLMLVLACCIAVAVAFDHLGSMIPDSSWGGMYVAVQEMWSPSAMPHDPETPSPLLDRAGSAPMDGRVTIESWAEPVTVIEEIKVSQPRWLG